MLATMREDRDAWRDLAAKKERVERQRLAPGSADSRRANVSRRVGALLPPPLPLWKAGFLTFSQLEQGPLQYSPRGVSPATGRPESTLTCRSILAL